MVDIAGDRKSEQLLSEQHRPIQGKRDSLSKIGYLFIYLFLLFVCLFVNLLFRATSSVSVSEENPGPLRRKRSTSLRNQDGCHVLLDSERHTATSRPISRAQSPWDVDHLRLSRGGPGGVCLRR